MTHKATYDGFMKRHTLIGEEPKRSFVLSRSFFTGSQRYGAVWTGDNQATIEDLKISIQMLLSMSVSGLGFVVADIGGFSGSPSAELLRKWTAVGIFYPFMR